MSKTTVKPKFSIGEQVCVRHGVTDPDFPDIPSSGWAGTISEIERGAPTRYLIELNERTLRSLHPIYQKRCERDGLVANEVWMFEEDLEPDGGGAVEIEQPTNIVTKPLSMKDQDDRIRAVFGLTSDDPLPDVDDETLLAYHKHLASALSFPFDGKYSFEPRFLETKTYAITILRLVDPEEFRDDEYGVFCEARRENEIIQLPLTEVEVTKRSPNRQLVGDYSYWFGNW